MLQDRFRNSILTATVLLLWVLLAVAQHKVSPRSLELAQWGCERTSAPASLSDLCGAALTNKVSLVGGRMLISLPRGIVPVPNGDQSAKYEKDRSVMYLRAGRDSLTIHASNDRRRLNSSENFSVAAKTQCAMNGGPQPIFGAPSKTSGGVEFVPFDFSDHVERPLRSLRCGYLRLPDGAILNFDLSVNHHGGDWNKIETLAARIFDSVSPGPVRGYKSNTVSIERAGIKLSIKVPDGWNGSTALSSVPSVMAVNRVHNLASSDLGGVTIGLADENRDDFSDGKQVEVPGATAAWIHRIDWFGNRKPDCSTPERCLVNPFKGRLVLSKTTCVYVTVAASDKRILSQAIGILNSLEQSNSVSVVQ